MNDENSKIEKALTSVEQIVKAVPVYQDIVQPAAQELGKSLVLVSKAVSIALAPVKVLVWGYSQIEDYINRKVAEKLSDVPPENIVNPPLHIVGPAFEALRYTGHEEFLRELYGNLIATSMNKETMHNAHPAYVEILKNLNSDEAKLLTLFVKGNHYPLIDIRSFKDRSTKVLLNNVSQLDKLVKLERADLLPNYIDNLCRLGILQIPEGMFLTREEGYTELENSKMIESIRKFIVDELKGELNINRKLIKLTNFGVQFVLAVVAEEKK